ncbi:MAG TPA: class II aldolase/adducin family protein [Clostridiaceae bacterium]|nr:class II aldolase/adducin family protein [Clostridiaceae bacterium]
MEESKARKLLVNTGKKLLEAGLVARTWGNISCRLDAENILITPSGLDYMKTKEEDIVKMNLTTGKWQGVRKPSGERRVHIAAYQAFPDVNFVIHTHQTYASALGLAGFEQLDITKEEKEALGGIMTADYGLPGTKKLTKAVKAAFQAGAKAVLMKNHGVLICGNNQEEAMSKAILLEGICKRNIKGDFEVTQDIKSGKAEKLLDAIKEKFRYAALVQTPAVLSCANRRTPIYAQVDDMAQMIGRKIPVVPDNEAAQALKRLNAVLVPGIGAVVRSESEDDMKAIKLLVDKAAICSIHTAACSEKARIGVIEAVLMKFVYKTVYSKQKG